MITTSGETEQKTIREIEDYILRELPRVLEQDTRFALFLEGLLNERFPRRDEFSQMLAEMRQMREETNRRFDEQRDETNRRFDETNLRFDEHRDKTNRRFDEHRDETNRRFDEINLRFDEHRDETNRRFDEHRDETNRRFDEQRDETNRRFDEQHGEILALKRDVIRISSSQENLLRRYDGQETWFKLNLGDLGNLKGKKLEEMFAAGLRYGLGDPDISAEQIRLRQRLKDEVFFPKGTEVDVVARNGEMIVFEIKATGSEDDVTTFAHKLKIFRDQNPGVRVRGVFACMGAEHLREHCMEEDIELLA